jgi:hypothetical protein
VTTEPEDKTGGEAQDEDSDEEQDRPTVAPPFDPVAFAQEVLGGKPSPAAGTPAVTPPSDRDAELGMPSRHGPHSRKTPQGMGLATPVRAHKPTPTDVAALEEARRRSSPSGRPTPQGLLSLANARIPSNLPPRKESSNTVGAVDREWEELATSPPPPLQQELIDTIARTDNPPSTKDAPDLAAAAAASAAAARSLAPVPVSAQEMNDRVSLGDYTGALEIAEKLLEIDPDDEPVKVCAESCRGVLRQMYTTRIGPLDRVPMVMVARDQLRWLSIDHRAGFVLSLVDGVSSLEMILDVSGMPELDALRILSELAQQRIISFR